MLQSIESHQGTRDVGWPRFLLVLAGVSFLFFLAYAHLVTEATLGAIKVLAPILKTIRTLQGSAASHFVGYAIGLVIGALATAALLAPVLLWKGGRSGQILCMAAVVPTILVGASGSDLSRFSGWVSSLTPLVGAMLVVFISQKWARGRSRFPA
jgi:hypothetical protein